MSTPSVKMDLEFWGNVLFWLLMGGILAPFVIAALGKSLKGRSNDTAEVSSYQPLMPDDQVEKILLAVHDPATGVITPPPDLCHKVIRLLEEDLEEGIELLSDYYGVSPPEIEINDALLEARGSAGMCSGNRIYITGDARIKTVLHEFLHYLMRIKGQVYDEDVEEIQADLFADRICRNASLYIEYGAKVNTVEFFEKRHKHWEKRYRKLLEEIFPNNKKAVEELMKDVTIDENEEEE